MFWNLVSSICFFSGCRKLYKYDIKTVILELSISVSQCRQNHINHKINYQINSNFVVLLYFSTFTAYFKIKKIDM